MLRLSVTLGRCLARGARAWRRAVLAPLALVLALAAVDAGAGQSALSPQAAITSPAAGSTLSGDVLVEGWALDPREPPARGGINPRDVQLWLGPYPDGRLLDYAQYGTPSEPAAAAFGPAFAATGFFRTWRTCSFPPGPTRSGSMSRAWPSQACRPSTSAR